MMAANGRVLPLCRKGPVQAVAGGFQSFVADVMTSGYSRTEDPEFLRRVRTLNLTGLVLTAFGLIWAVSFFAHGVWSIGVLLVALTVAYLASLMLLRWIRNLALVSHCVMALLFAGVLVSNWHTGGLSMSNDLAFFTVPVVAIFLMGAQGLIWVGVVCVTVGVFQYLDYAGFRFPQVIPEQDRTLDAILTFVTVLMVVTGVTYLYDRARRRSARQLLQAKERAEEASRVKSQFVANMSHEFRTPLNAIIGLTEITLQKDLPDEHRLHLEMVKKSAYSLLSLVEDILDMSRIEAGRLVIRPTPFDPRALLDDVITSLSSQADEKQNEVRVRAAEAVPDMVRGDADRVRQVLANLVDNAIKFTDQGRIEVRLERAEADWLVFVVQDTGIGIEPSQQRKVFESFSQADASTSRRHGGSGLGLAICDELVGLMGGSISVESQTGQGSRFEVRLELPEVRRPARGDRPLRILAAEDDPLGRELLLTILRSAGFLVDAVASGRQAIDAARSGDFDLVLMDIQMPGVDGLEAVRQIRQDEPADRRMPILALTAHAVDEERARCFAAGMDDFIVKPIEPKVLVGAIRRFFP